MAGRAQTPAEASCCRVRHGANQGSSYSATDSSRDLSPARSAGDQNRHIEHTLPQGLGKTIELHLILYHAKYREEYIILLNACHSLSVFSWS